MSMNVPPNEEPMTNQQPVVDETSITDVQTPDETVVADETVQTTPEQAAQVDEQAQAQQDAEVINAVGQAIADEQITATDIMTALLSDSFGLSPVGAQSLMQILLGELVDEATPDEVITQEEVTITPDNME